jgi:outer membrane receptor for ferrienterochelin and colicin
MKVIEVRPSKRFTGAWVSFEAPGVGPAFAAPEAKQKAIDYACGRFGGCTGEVHIYGDDAATIERKIAIDGRGQYHQARQ